MLTPTAGRIQVDGIALDNANRTAWQARIAYVPQTIFLLDATIAQNIALGRPAAAIDRERLLEAARLAQLDEFVGNLTCFTLAESLGGVESLVAHPASMTHASMDETARRIAGIDDCLVRLSIGIEDADDLVVDVSDALDAVLEAAPPASNDIGAVIEATV